ncbi:MAG: NAD(P)H-binding protein [Lysobacterales bacterium]
MNTHSPQEMQQENITLVLGGTGKTGRRVAERLKARNLAVRIGSRSAQPGFDWQIPATWAAALEGVTAVYISYSPDLAVPGAREKIRRFVDQAVAQGVQRLVLLSGRGEEEAQACERIVQQTDVAWTVIRSSWFMQNFSEGEFVGMVNAGAITLPAGQVPEPFIDVNDIADVAVAALTEQGHAYEVYEVTGPRLMTLSELAGEISRAAGRDIPFVSIPSETFTQAIAESGAPKDVAWLLDYLFSTVLDGRNAHVSDGVQRALGRQPADFADFAQRMAATKVWDQSNSDVAA